MCMCIVYGQHADVSFRYFDGDTFKGIHAVIDMLQRITRYEREKLDVTTQESQFHYSADNAAS